MKEDTIVKYGGGHYTCSKCGETIFGSKEHKCNMKTEQELKDQCTPDIIKRMVELAEGFEFKTDGNSIHVVRLHLAQYEYEDWILRLPYCHRILFPLLIHRAVEGWNKQYPNKYIINFVDKIVWFDGCIKDYVEIKNYQPQSLTQAECAMLHCLMDIFKGENNQ